jgi:predicted ATP-grasp superfamily ATP-dependent carboligase
MKPQAILLAPTDGGLALARGLGRRGVEVTVLAEGTWRWVARTRWAASRRMGQLPGDRESWLECLSDLERRGDGVLIPATDRLSEFVAAERERIPSRLRSFESGTSAHRKLIDKGSLYEFAAGARVRAPWTVHLASPADLARVAGEVDYPCLLKPALSHHWRRLIGERRALVVSGADELARIAGPALDAELELLVTEHVPGPDRNLEGSVVIRAGDGSYPLVYGIRKLRSYPPGFGSGSLHEAADVPEAIALARRLLDAAGFAGVANVEFKRHAGTGELVLIDVNPRLPQCWGLADAAGTDASWRLYATLAGIEIGPQPAPRLGIRSIAPSLEPKAVLANFTERRQTLRQLLAGYRRVRDLSGLSLADPAPVLVLIAAQIRSFARRLARPLRRRT